MPYIKQEDREKLNIYINNIVAILQENPDKIEGNLNYVITKITKDLFRSLKLGLLINYKNMNGIIGALECVKLEFYRRCLVPYENSKIQSNGDV